jgi:hypothetical protein
MIFIMNSDGDNHHDADDGSSPLVSSRWTVRRGCASGRSGTWWTG